MTKTERRAAQLQRHYNALNALFLACGVELKPQFIRNRSSRLLQIERIAHKSAEDYCNGDITSETWDRISEIQTENVQKLFNGQLKGLFINGDARGHALKISDKVMREEYSQTGLFTDWGGYGLLAPEIDGN
jgi:hypothetical protein